MHRRTISFETAKFNQGLKTQLWLSAWTQKRHAGLWERRKEEETEGDLPLHRLRPRTPHPFVTNHNICLAGRANNGEVEGKQGSGDPPTPFALRSDKFSSKSEALEATVD